MDLILVPIKKILNQCSIKLSKYVLQKFEYVYITHLLQV